MHGSERTTTTRELRAIQIPDGTPTILEAGTPVRIAQSLGDTYTLVTPWGQMVRVEAKDADAIGKEAPAVAEAAGHGQSLEDRVWAQLRTCFDPEIPVNIVDLGLIYDCALEPHPDGEGQLARIRMTLTAPGCGMGQVLADDVHRKVRALPGIAEVDVDLVFDPPWNPNMMTDEARLQLGFM